MSAPIDAAAATRHAGDALAEAVLAAGTPACVGIDVDPDRLPPLAAGGGDGGDALVRLEAFALGIVDAIAGRVGVVKPQSAGFERFGPAGMEILERVIAAARSAGLCVVLDAKRGDIGVSSRHYGVAAFGEDAGGPGPEHAQWLTASPYLGFDGVLPLLRGAAAGVFVLVRTSNPGGDEVQALALDDGRTVAEAVADLLQAHAVAEDRVGRHGYSCLGAVVGATRGGEIARLRERMPACPLLIPGYGAQGGTADDVRPAFDDRGLGAVVNASRSVIQAWETASAGAPGRRWTDAVAEAADRFADDVGTVAGLR